MWFDCWKRACLSRRRLIVGNWLLRRGIRILVIVSSIVVVVVIVVGISCGVYGHLWNLNLDVLTGDWYSGGVLMEAIRVVVRLVVLICHVLESRRYPQTPNDLFRLPLQDLSLHLPGYQTAFRVVNRRT